MPWAPTDEGANYILGLFANAGTKQTSGGTAASADNDPVGSWEDQSGNGNKFEQSVSGQRPVLKTSGGPTGLGSKLIRSAGTDDVLGHASSIVPGTAWTIGIICTKGNAAQYVLSQNTGAPAIITGFAGSGDFEFYGSTPRFTIQASPAAGLHSISVGGTGTGMASRYDSGAGGTSGTAAPALALKWLFAHGSDGNDSLIGDISAVIVFDRYDATLLSNVEAYLAGLIAGAAAPTLSYDDQPYALTEGTPFTSDEPTSTGGDPTGGFSALDTLPTGLSIDPDDGIISGTPTVPQASAAYTIQLDGPGGSDTFDVNISVAASGGGTNTVTIRARVVAQTSKSGTASYGSVEV